jgi:hypothetical protein
MSLRRTFRFVTLLAPLLVFALVLMLPFYSARLSLILQGHPFARVVSKKNLDVFKFMSTDSFACRAIVFSNEKAVGWICLPSTSGFAAFVPFSANPNLIGGVTSEPWFDFPLIIEWSLRWWLLPVQAVVLLLWLRQREKRVQYARAVTRSQRI